MLNFLEMTGLYSTVSLAYACATPGTDAYEVLQKLDPEVWETLKQKGGYVPEELEDILPQIKFVLDDFAMGDRGEDEAVAFRELYRVYSYLLDYVNE